MTDINNRRDPPADWREKLIAVLSAVGITELPKVSKWKRFAAFARENARMGSRCLFYQPGDCFHRYLDCRLSDLGHFSARWFHPSHQSSRGHIGPSGADLRCMVRFSPHPPPPARGRANLLRAPADASAERREASPVLFLRSFNFDSNTRPSRPGRSGCRSVRLRCRHRSSIWYR
jgi:hypothetical protein